MKALIVVMALLMPLVASAHEESTRDVGLNLCELAKAASPETLQDLINATGRHGWSADAYCATFCGMDQVYCQNACTDCLVDFFPADGATE